MSYNDKFYVGQRILIENTTAVELDNQYATIVGFYHSDQCILMLDNPYNENQAIVLTKACVSGLSNY